MIQLPDVFWRAHRGLPREPSDRDAATGCGTEPTPTSLTRTAGGVTAVEQTR